MPVVLVGARILLALVFLIAGLTKLADLRGSRRAVADFGVPAFLAPVTAVALPVAELAVALAMIPRQTAWWGALGALFLLLAFSAGIAGNLARGRTPECHCFGQLHSEPVGWSTLVRNALLGMVALFVVLGGLADSGPGALDWLLPLTVGQRVAVGFGTVGIAVLVGQLWLLYMMTRQNRQILVRLQDHDGVTARRGRSLPVGEPAPLFGLRDLGGAPVTLLQLLGAGKPLLLVFTDPDCAQCTALMPEVGAWQRAYAHQIEIAVISRGSVEANAEKATYNGLTGMLLQADREVEEAYGVVGTPSAVTILPNGRVGAPMAAGGPEIRAMLANLLGLPGPEALPLLEQMAAIAENEQAGAVPLTIGEAAPDVVFTDLMGEEVRLSDVTGTSLLVLFWSSTCGFCQRMLPDLKVWEAVPPDGAPQLFVVLPDVNSGNQIAPFRSTVVVDREFAAATAFCAQGTPMAILIDAEGRIASDLAAGADAVLALAYGQGDSEKAVAG